jgi:hypothetical protein
MLCWVHYISYNLSTTFILRAHYFSLADIIKNLYLTIIKIIPKMETKCKATYSCVKKKCTQMQMIEWKLVLHKQLWPNKLHF